MRKHYLKMRGQQAEIAEIEEHPMLDLLNDANSFHTGLSLRKLTMIYLDLVGDSFWLKQRNAVGAPVAAWPTRCGFSRRRAIRLRDKGRFTSVCSTRPPDA